MPKYNIDDIVFVFNLFEPLVAQFKIQGVIKEGDLIYYTTDREKWIREDYLHETDVIAYAELVSQAQKEMGGLIKECKDIIDNIDNKQYIHIDENMITKES